MSSLNALHRADQHNISVTAVLEDILHQLPSEPRSLTSSEFIVHTPTTSCHHILSIAFSLGSTRIRSSHILVHLEMEPAGLIASSGEMSSPTSSGFNFYIQAAHLLEGAQPLCYQNGLHQPPRHHLLASRITLTSTTATTTSRCSWACSSSVTLTEIQLFSWHRQEHQPHLPSTMHQQQHSHQGQPLYHQGLTSLNLVYA